jgi:hypothetical protein
MISDRPPRFGVGGRFLLQRSACCEKWKNMQTESAIAQNKGGKIG